MDAQCSLPVGGGGGGVVEWVEGVELWSVLCNGQIYGAYWLLMKLTLCVLSCSPTTLLVMLTKQGTT